MKAASVKSVRCAIYARVSTDQGLDQEFNSLDAQYEASSAYIRSQAHAGWTLIKTRYDDGGYSGGSTDRSDLQRLLARRYPFPRDRRHRRLLARHLRGDLEAYPPIVWR
jgi:Resolvase, N terminal domain